MNNLVSLPVLTQALSKVLLELRAEMTAAAEQQVIASATQKEETLNVQVLVDRHTKDLKVGKSFLAVQMLDVVSEPLVKTLERRRSLPQHS